VQGTTATTGAGAGVYGSITGSGNTGYGGYFTNSSSGGWTVYAGGSSPNYFAAAVAIGTNSTPNAGASLDMSSETNSLLLPTGTTGQRPTAKAGMIRYNSTTPAVEAYYSNTWNNLGGGSGGTVTLGTSTAAANPRISGDATSGFYTPAASTVAVTTAGTEIMAWTTSGENIVEGVLQMGGSTVLSTPASDTTSIAVGVSALAGQNATDLYNTAVGNQALYSTTTGYDNTAVGYYALEADNGYEDTALGAYADQYATSDSGEIAIGYFALQGSSGSPLTGSNNIAVGLEALQKLQGATSDNVAMGALALGKTTTGANNTAVGFEALYDNTTGSDNTALGMYALQNSTGANNTAVGYQAGNAVISLASGSDDTFIGSSAAADTSTDTNETVIGYSATGKGSNTNPRGL